MDHHIVYIMDMPYDMESILWTMTWFITYTARFLDELELIKIQNDTRKWVIGTKELLLRPRKKVSLKYFGHYQFLKLFEWLKHCKTQIFNLGRWFLGIFCIISRFRGYLTVSELFSPIFSSSRHSKRLFFSNCRCSLHVTRKYPIVYSIFLNWIFNYQCFPIPIGRYVRYI